MDELDEEAAFLAAQGMPLSDPSKADVRDPAGALRLIKRKLGEVSKQLRAARKGRATPITKLVNKLYAEPFRELVTLSKSSGLLSKVHPYVVPPVVPLR